VVFPGRLKTFCYLQRIILAGRVDDLQVDFAAAERPGRTWPYLAATACLTFCIASKAGGKLFRVTEGSPTSW
jgi:hypothetical protein